MRVRRCEKKLLTADARRPYSVRVMDHTNPNPQEETMTPKRDVLKAQREAMKFVTKYIEDNSLQIGDLPEGQFSVAMDAIVKAMVNAYAAGYMLDR
jgi:hypothetical protein